MTTSAEEYLHYLQTIGQDNPRTMALHRRVVTLWNTFLATRACGTDLKAGVEDLLAFMTWRQTEGKLIDRSLAAELCVLRRYYIFLHDRRLLRHNPLRIMPDLVCKPPRESAYLTVDECTRMLQQIDRSTPVGVRDYTILALLWSTGLRTRELQYLDWPDIDQQAATLLVRHGKGAKQRQLFLNDQLRQGFAEYHKIMGSPTAGPVFTASGKNQHQQQEGRRISKTRIVEITRAAAAAIGTDKKVSPRMLRHTFATHMYEAGVPIEDIKEMLGHDEEMETTVYIHVTMRGIRALLQDHLATR